MTDLKGQYKGNCNRTACQKPNAIWYNHSTRKYYCEECAITLNRYNRQDAMEMFGHDLCTHGENNPREPELTIPEGGELHSLLNSLRDQSTYYLESYKDFKECMADIPQPLKKGQKRPSKYARRAEMRTEPKIGRNEPCSCGSGLKYKKCCLNKKEE